MMALRPYEPLETMPASVAHVSRFESSVHFQGMPDASSSSARLLSEQELSSSYSRSSFQQLVRGSTVWSVRNRYQNCSECSFVRHGMVCLATDQHQANGENVLIEKLDAPFESAEAARATYRRLRLLTELEHENIVSLTDCFSPDTSQTGFNDVYFVTDSTERACDLGTVIRSESLTDEHVCVLTYQILRALKYLHSAGVVHGDLKPSDFLVSENCDLLLVDLGVDTYVSDTSTTTTDLTGSEGKPAHAQLINAVKFGQAADVWSVGCIMAEMITSRALFPGRDHVDQLARIQQTIESQINRQTEGDCRAFPLWESRRFEEIFAGVNSTTVDLLEQLLAVDSKKRICVEESLRHPYFKLYHDPDDEPVCSKLVGDVSSIAGEGFSGAALWKEGTRQLVLGWQQKTAENTDHREMSSLKVTMTI